MICFIDVLAILIAPLILGILINKNNYNENEKIEFAILQPNVSIDDKRFTLSTDAIKDLLDKSQDYIKIETNRLLIWPETAFDHYNNQINFQIADRFLRTNISLLTGVYEKANDNVYNSGLGYWLINHNYIMSKKR